MESLILTTPVVVPATSTDTYHVVSLTLNTEAMSLTLMEPGLIVILLRDNHNERSEYRYEGRAATDMIKTLNTANLTTKSMHKRVLEKLNADGLLVGTVTGTPDPPTAQE